MTEVWSCDPKDIPEWTEEAELRLLTALGEVFNWDPEVIEEAKRKVSEHYASK